MTRTIDNTQDVLDSRDVIARIEELEQEREPLQEDLYEAQKAHDELLEAGSPDEDELDELQDKLEAAKASVAEWDEDNAEELKALKSLADEAEGYAEDWKHGATLIRETYFEDYARELANDCYDMKKAEGWPFCHIDWEAAAEALQQDYTSVEFDGVTYWVR